MPAFYVVTKRELKKSLSTVLAERAAMGRLGTGAHAEGWGTEGSQGGREASDEDRGEEGEWYQRGPRVRARTPPSESFQRIILASVWRVKPRIVVTEFLVVHEGDPFVHLLKRVDRKFFP